MIKAGLRLTFVQASAYVVQSTLLHSPAAYL